MKKIIFSLFIFVNLVILLFFLSGCSLEINKNSSTKNNAESYETQKLAVKEPVEEILYTFSTPIQDKSPGRQNNIRLTCSSLNGTIVKSGNIFSFCDTVGKATVERGYQEAKIFGSNGEVTMGLGGGNCQVSSTLYNAILQDTNFEIIERHPHAGRVYYVEERKRCSSCLWKC